MIFSSPLISGKLIKRYKRFLADVILDDGSVVTAHCPNSGAMLDITAPHNSVWLSYNPDPKRKLSYTWEMVEVDDQLIGVNTMTPNTLIGEALQKNAIDPLKGYSTIQREVKYGENSRIDYLLSDKNKPSCYLEIKNVHLKRGGVALFPDSVTTRGTKHMIELTKVVKEGYRAVILYVIQRNDCTHFDIAKDIDSQYSQAFRTALHAGVECFAYTCNLTPNSITLGRSIEIIE